MSNNKTHHFILFFKLILLGGFLLSCEKATEVVEDVQSLAALKNVEFSYDDLKANIRLPEGALTSDMSFQELLEEDSATYANPANYTMEISSYFIADNTKESAEDTKFDGMLMNLVMDTIYSNPIKAETEAFEIKKDQSKTIDIQANISLETHRLPGLYIFEQTVKGNDLDTKTLIELLYNIGGEEGSFNLPEMQKDIPTRASEEMKDFLSGLIDSGIFEN